MKDINITIGPRLESLRPISLDKTKQSDGQKGSFGDALKGAVREVNQLQGEANTSIKHLIAGESRNLHETMIAMEKAGIAFRLMVEVRNKVIEAYNEIMRMQV